MVPRLHWRVNARAAVERGLQPILAGRNAQAISSLAHEWMWNIVSFRKMAQPHVHEHGTLDFALCWTLFCHCRAHAGSLFAHRHTLSRHTGETLSLNN